MIADPLAVLEEGEIHFGFSNMFRDPVSGFNDTMLHDIDLLVARLPAHLPSDIQKVMLSGRQMIYCPRYALLSNHYSQVRAVFKPELRCYRDVIIFSSKGQESLASKLSG